MRTPVALHPLRVEDAEEMVHVLASPSLYTVTGGCPPTLDGLRARYAAQVRGSGRDDEEWRNWIVRGDGVAVGFVQATMTGGTATLAWLIGEPWQGRGLASAAVADMCDQLWGEGIQRFEAWIAPGHAPSERVASRAGLERTGEIDDDGEVRWSSP